MSAKTTITALDSVAPGTAFNVGDGAHDAVRVNVVAGGAGGGTVVGNLTNNNAPPSNNNLGVLPAVANASAPTYTEGDQVLLSVDLTGTLRVSGGGGGGGNVNLIQVGGSAIAIGQAAMAASLPVVIASDQSKVKVTGAGTAGTADTGVMTVQGIASGTPVIVSQATASNLKAQVSIVAEYTQASGATFSASVGTSAVQLGSSAANVGVLVTADPAGGSAYIYVGFSNSVTAGTNAATDGVKLAAGAGIIFPVSNSNAIWLIASAVSQTAFVGVI